MSLPLADIITSALMILGTLMFLVAAIGMLRCPDSLTRVNVLAPAIGAGLPLILVGAFVHDVDENGFSFLNLVTVLIAVAAMLIASSFASNALARSLYRSGGMLDEKTRFNDLAD